MLEPTNRGLYPPLNQPTKETGRLHRTTGLSSRRKAPETLPGPANRAGLVCTNVIPGLSKISAYDCTNRCVDRINNTVETGKQECKHLHDLFSRYVAEIHHKLYMSQTWRPTPYFFKSRSLGHVIDLFRILFPNLPTEPPQGVFIIRKKHFHKLPPPTAENTTPRLRPRHRLPMTHAELRTLRLEAWKNGKTECKGDRGVKPPHH